MKKTFGILFVFSFLLLSACTDNEGTAGEDGQETLQVVATTTMIADLMEVIGGEHVEVTGLMGPGVDPHDYQPSASDVDVMSNADVVAYNGLYLEEQFVEVFEQLDQRGVTSFIMADAIPESEYLDSEEDDDLEHDPHIWFSVEHWIAATEHVAEELSVVDPENAEEYQANASAYVVELNELSEYIHERVQEVPEQSRYLVTAHDAFQYFGEEFGFEVVGLQGINTQTEAGTGDISGLANFIVEQEINAVFVESSVSPRNIEALIEAVRSRGHEVENAGELYSDALGSEEEDAETYIKMYQANIDTIVDALN